MIDVLHARWHELKTKLMFCGLSRPEQLELDALQMAEDEARKRLRWSASGEIGAMVVPCANARSDH